MNICFVTSECVPFVKTGGLADVSGALPKALSELGLNVIVFLPCYSSIDLNKYNLNYVNGFEDAKVKIGEEFVKYNLLYYKIDKLSFYFIDSNKYFHRDSIYTNDPDEDERFIFFQKCVLDVLLKLRFKPDIIHINDWQTALIPELINISYSDSEFLKGIKTVLSIHNIAYQGIFNKESINKANLPQNKFFAYGPYEHYGNFNFLKTGILYSDYILTVSPTYAKEILTSDFGFGLEGVLKIREKHLTGILNGIDETQWNPEKDNIIVKNYNFNSIRDKSVNKSHLLKYTGTNNELSIPVFGIISRLVWQKGFEILEPFIDDLLSRKVKLFVLGKGEYKYEEFFRNAQKRFPEKLFYYCEYNNELAHFITAGSDIFLMPSRYEPCGLNQMYSLKYGTIPIVHKTGGLTDTVMDLDEFKNKANGFAFTKFVPDEFYNKILTALKLYTCPEKWLLLQENGMKSDFSWDKSAKKYLEIYNYILS